MKILTCLLVLFSLSAFSATREITLVNYQFEGTKQWLPGTIVVKKGDEVKIKLINNVPSGLHSFRIKEFGQKVSIKKGETKTISFKADKAGIFESDCYLHPAHVGGQLIVLE